MYKSLQTKICPYKACGRKTWQKSIEVANVKIIDKVQAEYETAGDFEYLSEEQALRMETINELVEQFGEEIYQ